MVSLCSLSILQHWKQPSLFSGSICFKFLWKFWGVVVGFVFLVFLFCFLKKSWFVQLKATKTPSHWTVRTWFNQSNRVELDIANICITLSARATKHRHGYNHVMPLCRFILKHVALITPEWITSATEYLPVYCLWRSTVFATMLYIL